MIPISHMWRERAERLQALQGIYPMVAGTPAALPILEDILKLQFGDEGTRYVGVLRQALELQAQSIQQPQAPIQEQ